MVNTGVSWQAT